MLLLVSGCVCSTLDAMLPGEVCGNHRDDDGDTFEDCADDECFQACTNDCVDLCAVAEGDRCSDEGFPARCVRGASGCAEFLRLSGCPHETLCNAGACIDAGTCVDACVLGGTRCTLAGLEESCITGPAGCKEWSLPRACAGGGRCMPGDVSCTPDAGSIGGGSGGGGGGSGGGGSAGGAAAGGSGGGGGSAGGSAGGAAAGGSASGGGSGSGQSCASYFDCTDPKEVCDPDLGRCVPCGNGIGTPCCVDQVNLVFVCGQTGVVCGNHPGNKHLCCQNRGDGCCQQGGCSSTGTCCKCPRNGLNACVQPSFGCGGC